MPTTFGGFVGYILGLMAFAVLTGMLVEVVNRKKTKKENKRLERQKKRDALGERFFHHLENLKRDRHLLAYEVAKNSNVSGRFMVHLYRPGRDFSDIEVVLNRIVDDQPATGSYRIGTSTTFFRETDFGYPGPIFAALSTAVRRFEQPLPAA